MELLAVVQEFKIGKTPALDSWPSLGTEMRWTEFARSEAVLCRKQGLEDVVERRGISSTFGTDWHFTKQLTGVQKKLK